LREKEGAVPGRRVSVEEKATGLMEWAMNHGARMGECCVAPSQYGGLGVIATGDISPGDTLITIPRRLVITHERCHDESMTRAGGVLKALDSPIFTSLLMTLLAESESPSSFYREYLLTLPGPRDLHNAPYMTQKELDTHREASIARQTACQEAGAAEEKFEENVEVRLHKKIEAVLGRLKSSQSYIKQEITEAFPEAFPVDGEAALDAADGRSLSIEVS